jgi:Copper type II ascorbate-dependent monooxygenase, C-terminal domain
MRLFAAIAVGLLVACGGSGDSGSPPDAPGLSGDLYKLTWGPVTVAPGQENTQCIQVRLANTAAIKVHEMHNLLGPGSHHLIVYKDDMTTEERTTPFDCQPFTGALNPSGMVAPIMITQRSDDPLYLPEGVAYTMNANQMMRIEMHYINATDQPIETTAEVELYAAPEETIHDEANILFIGTPDINIAAGATVTVNQFFTPKRAQLNLDGAKFFAITGHTHQFGTEMTVNVASTNSGTDVQSVYAPPQFEWDEPATQTHKPEFQIPAGNQAGFDFKCVYKNTSNQNVQFGESANDEMCFFWAYYYPSQGSHVCVHTQQFGGIDLCCPDAGTVCDMLQMQF